MMLMQYALQNQRPPLTKQVRQTLQAFGSLGKPLPLPLLLEKSTRIHIRPERPTLGRADVA